MVIKEYMLSLYHTTSKVSVNFRENLLIFWGIWGEAKLILGIWGAKETYFKRAEVLSSRELGGSIHYFQGSREHRPPPPLGGLTVKHLKYVKSFLNKTQHQE